jgi:hypothetical protein
MEADISAIFLACATLCTGAFFGVLGSNLVAIRYKSGWICFFYILSVASFLGGIIGLILYYSKMNNMDYFSIIGLIVSGIVLFIFTCNILHKKHIYKIPELESIINKWTTISDKSEIRLLGRDLNFFGDTPACMEKNGQYCHLKSLNFSKVNILCEKKK